MVKYFVIVVVVSVMLLAALVVTSDLYRLSRGTEQLIEGLETVYGGIRLIDYINNGPLAPLFRRLPVIQAM